MKAPSERVSTVGVRNQVTLPKVIRKEARIKDKTLAYIQARDKEESLVITLEPPGEGVYNRIKISEKGQLVIPKNLRESKKIKEGNNLVFSIEGDQEIAVKKLAERRGEKDNNRRWQFFLDMLELLETVKGLEKLDTVKNSLVLVLEKDLSSDKLFDLVTELESNTGTRLLVEKLQENEIKLTPIQ